MRRVQWARDSVRIEEGNMIIELRVDQYGEAWENIPPIRADIGTSARRVTLQKRASAIAKALSKGSGQEVRWNYLGSTQGYYTGGF